MEISCTFLINTKISYFCYIMMTIEELKSELLGKSLPDRVGISAEQVVVDVDTFLKIQFIEVEAWKKDLEKCPAYLRLIKFREAIIAPQKFDK